MTVSGFALDARSPPAKKMIMGSDTAANSSLMIRLPCALRADISARSASVFEATVIMDVAEIMNRLMKNCPMM